MSLSSVNFFSGITRSTFRYKMPFFTMFNGSTARRGLIYKSYYLMSCVGLLIIIVLLK